MHSHDDGLAHSHSHDASHHHDNNDNNVMEVNDDDDDDAADPDMREQHHQATVTATFDSYLRHSLSANQRRRADYWRLPVEQRDLLIGYSDLLKQVDSKLQVNAKFVEAAIATNVFPPSPEAALSAPAPKEADHEKLRSTLRQVARDWSETGKRERTTTYTPMIEALQRHFRDLPSSHRGNAQVLVPGAGLGRLAWEIVNLGFSCQANEFSLYMLIISAFILNNIHSENAFELHPYIHSFSNRRTRSDLLAPISVPDVLPTRLSAQSGDFSFAAGDFLDVYRNDAETWDAVVTCFFIDTARNIVAYLELIHRILKAGGVWINCGPTLWHFENSEEGASSIELTVEDVKNLARRIGFIIMEEREVHTAYTSNPVSTLRHEYSASFWVAVKA